MNLNTISLALVGKTNKLPSFLIHRVSAIWISHGVWTLSLEERWRVEKGHKQNTTQIICDMSFPWCVDSLEERWRVEKRHKQNTTQNTHTHTPPFVSSLHKFLWWAKFSNLLEARCLIDSMQWASSSPRPAKAGRQAGRQHVLYPRSNSKGSFQVLWFIFFFVDLQAPSGQWIFFGTNFFFFPKKIGIFFGNDFFF